MSNLEQLGVAFDAEFGGRATSGIVHSSGRAFQFLREEEEDGRCRAFGIMDAPVRVLPLRSFRLIDTVNLNMFVHFFSFSPIGIIDTFVRIVFLFARSHLIGRVLIVPLPKTKNISIISWSAAVGHIPLVTLTTLRLTIARFCYK